jgi:hypothetical protein
MDALKKAIVVLWRYIDLVEKDHADLRREVNAIGDLLIRYLGEIKVEEKHNSNTIAAMMKVLGTIENTASHLAPSHQERLKTMNEMQAILTDLAIDSSATRQ